MVQVTLEEAATRLPQLVAQAEAGEEVWLTTHKGSVVRLMAQTQNGNKEDATQPRFGSAKDMVWMAPDFAPPRQPRKAGSAKGMGCMTPDFEEPLEDFKEYME